MDLDKALVSTIAREGKSALHEALSRGVSAELLYGEGKLAFEFLVEHWKQYSQLPTKEVIEGKTGIDVGDVQGAAGFFTDEVLNRKLHEVLKEGVVGAIGLLEKRKPKDAIEALEGLVLEARRAQLAPSRVEALPALGPEVWEYYQRVKNGERGILTPWETVNESTYGLWPEDLALFAARMGIGKCVEAGSRIPDPVTGVVRTVEEVVAREGSVLSLSDGRVVARRPSAWLCTGEKDCIEIRTRIGRKITVTPEHPMLTSRGWVKAEDLKVSDHVVAVARVPEPIEPVLMDPFEVELLAVLLSEGSFSGKHVGFSTADEEYLSFVKVTAGKFGVRVVHRSKYDYDFVSERPVRELLKRHGFERERSKEKWIPEAIYRLPNAYLKRFLRMFWWGDGGKDGSIVLASERMIDDLQHLLLRFGVVSRKRFKLTRFREKVFDSWELRVESWTIGRFKALMRGLPGSKGKAIADIPDSTNPNTDNVQVTDEMVEAFSLAAKKYRRVNCSPEDRRGLYVEAGKLMGRKDPRQTALRDFTEKNGKRSVGRKTLRSLLDVAGSLLEEWAWLVCEDIVFVEVVAVRNVGVRKVFDLTVPDTNCFVVEGLVAHNTWASILITAHAWHTQQKKVLYATTEMSKIKIAMRFFAYQCRLPYDHLRRGKLSAFAEVQLQDEIRRILDDERLMIIGGDFDFRIESFAAAITESEPDLVVLDGAYLMKVAGANRLEKAANAFDEMKRICKRTKVPTVVTTQLNRDAKTNSPKSVQADTIALTDVAGWNADLIYGMVQTDDMKRDQKMILKPLKFREGEGQDIELNWNFETMDFSEVPQPGVRGPAAGPDPFGTGVATPGSGQKDLAPSSVPF